MVHDAEDDRYRLVMLERQRQRRAGDSERIHLIYGVVEFVGRWSMIDVFCHRRALALVRMGGLMNIYPAIGAVIICAGGGSDHTFSHDILIPVLLGIVSRIQAMRKYSNMENKSGEGEVQRGERAEVTGVDLPYRHC